MPVSTLGVTSLDGVRLAVTRYPGPAEAPVLICVHGFPDDSTLWREVASELADRYQVVAYDVRGAGSSDRPSRTRDYRLERLAADLAAVADAVSPGRRVHLLAHDWGSIQVWHALEHGLDERVASYTSISGPSLDHSGRWMRSRLRHRPGDFLRQLRSSTYIGFFQLPLIMEAVSRAGIFARTLKRLDPTWSGRALHADVAHGLKLYRANMLRRLIRPRPQPVRVPVQVIAPLRDRFVSVPLQTQLRPELVPDLSVLTVDSGHWLPLAQPGFVARAVADFITAKG